MSSIIDFFNANKLNYTASGSSDSCSNEFYPAFDKNDKCFYSVEDSPYWQVTFEYLVTIASYIISAPLTTSWYTTDWKISYSLDGSSFTDVQTYSKDLKGNTEKFLLPYQINCKIFRITGFDDNLYEGDLLFNSFDCFGSVLLKIIKNQCSCNYYYYKRRLIQQTSYLLYFLLS